MKNIYQFSSVAQLCPTLCNPMNHSTPGLPITFIKTDCSAGYKSSLKRIPGLSWWLSGKESACQSMQETRVWSLIWEDPTCQRATKPMCHNYWACALEPGSCTDWAHVPQLLRPACPQLQQEKSLQWEACVPELERSLHSPEPKKSPWNIVDPAQPKINTYLKKCEESFPEIWIKRIVYNVNNLFNNKNI